MKRVLLVVVIAVCAQVWYLSQFALEAVHLSDNLKSEYLTVAAGAPPVQP